MVDVEGYVDGWDGRLLWGWACSIPENEQPLTVEIISPEGRVIASGSAESFRGDLASAGKRQGFCGFSLPLTAAETAMPFVVLARAGDVTTTLPGGPVHYEGSTQRDTTAGDVPLCDDRGARGHVDFADRNGVGGWMHEADMFAPPVHLLLRVDGADVSRVIADRWREDLEDVRQGNGRVGFHFSLPAACFGGAAHAVEICREDGSRLHDEPMTIALPGPAPREIPHRDPDPCTPIHGPVELSIIVNFYDMHREADRTLTSLSRRFQRDIGDLSYEVVCIDNGSTPAMTEDSVTRHGPEFHLFRPSVSHSSPIFALNEAAATARGRYLAVMIDGAHLLSPGVLSEAVAALREGGRTMVAIRHWFIGGDQRWLSTAGYSRAHEDLPFARIGWPDCGYDIFKISAPIFDSPNTWFDSMSESNCLFMSAADFAELGGYDDAFDMPGAGFANLDLFARAAQLPDMRVVALVGEASFHQYHGGTTTNVADAEKESRVRRYAAGFKTLRGHDYTSVDRERLRFRGAIHSDFAMNARQRPSGRVRLGLTGAIRPIPASQTFDNGARDYAATAYVESGGPARTVWAGQPTGLAPADLIEIQQMLWNERPDVLVLREVTSGLVAFILSILPAILLEGVLPLWLTRHGDGPTPPGVRRVVGDFACPAVEARVMAEIGTAEGVSVLFQPREDEAYPLAPLSSHARLVSPGGYLVVLGAALGQPGIAYTTRWTASATRKFLENRSDFVVDRAMNGHFVSTCPDGFLRRLPNTRADYAYDPTLDLFEESDNV